MSPEPQYKFGTWYPIESAPASPHDGPGPDFLVWVATEENPSAIVPRTRAPRVAYANRYSQGGKTYWAGGDAQFCEHFTHWMPLPPGPEEMAAKLDLETIIRARIKKVEKVIRGKYTLHPILYDAGEEEIGNLMAILREAGLE